MLLVQQILLTSESSLIPGCEWDVIKKNCDNLRPLYSDDQVGTKTTRWHARHRSILTNAG